MLPGSSAKAAQNVFRHVMTTLYRDVFNGVGHVRYGDFNEAFCDLFPRSLATCRLADIGTHRLTLLLHNAGIENFIAVRPEYSREELRLYLAGHHIAIGE